MAAVFSDEIRAELGEVFAKIEQPIVLEVALDEREISKELFAYVEELSGMTDKITYQKVNGEDAPFVRITTPNFRSFTFHGVPGGTEFTNFVLAIYHISTGKIELSDDEKSTLLAVLGEHQLKLFITLSCGICPEMVSRLEQIALLNPNISVDIYDLFHFMDYRDQHNIMSVPCLIADGTVAFGRMEITEIVEHLQSQASNP